MAKCLRCGAGSEWIQGRVLDERAASAEGEFKQNERGFYHFYPAPGQGLSAHDCRRVAVWLKAHNAAVAPS